MLCDEIYKKNPSSHRLKVNIRCHNKQTKNNGAKFQLSPVYEPSRIRSADTYRLT